jgi:hypothetical protein
MIVYTSVEITKHCVSKSIGVRFNTLRSLVEDSGPEDSLLQ